MSEHLSMGASEPQSVWIVRYGGFHAAYTREVSARLHQEWAQSNGYPLAQVFELYLWTESPRHIRQWARDLGTEEQSA